MSQAQASSAPSGPVEDAARVSWNAWPATAAEAQRALLVPLGVAHTPLRPANAQRAYAEPLVCPGAPCAAVYSPHCAVDPEGKWWTCCMCGRRNAVSGASLLLSANSSAAAAAASAGGSVTVEYALPRLPAQSAVVVLALNTAVAPEELAALKDAVSRAVSLLPANTRVALVSFGEHVRVHDLRSADAAAAYAFQGSCLYGPRRAHDLLGLPLSSARFVVALRECEFALSARLDELAADAPPPAGQRAPNATGLALSVVCGLLDGACRNVGARAMFFVGAPCTTGPGTVVGADVRELMRSHHALAHAGARHAAAAGEYYADLAQQYSAAGHAVDLLCCSWDQVGLHEMRAVAERTGGVVMLYDTFAGDVFAQSLMTLLEKDYRGLLKMAFRATVEVVCSRELKVMGAIGHLTSLNKTTQYVSDRTIGLGGTSAWQSCALDANSTHSFFFEVVAPPQETPSQSVGYIQILTHFYNNCGQAILRVTTLSRPLVSDPNGAAVLQSFDQDVAVALTARLAVEKSYAEGEAATVRWLDRTLVQQLALFATFRRDNANSTFALPPNAGRFPLAVYHLRRGCLVSVFNASPDETAFYRFAAGRADVASALLMVQPSLRRYYVNARGEAACEAVELSLSSVSADHVLLLDAFFWVVVMVGHSLTMRHRKGETDEATRAVFARAAADAKACADGRFPRPPVTECSQYSSDSRFLMSVLDPGDTSVPTADLLSEDVGYSVFREHFIKLVLQQS
eukprot:m51a1_g374 Sec23B (743) ;mRNA; r:638211-640770